MSDLWFKHLAASLSRNGVAAYLWNARKDSFEWTGSGAACFGPKEKHLPATNAAFNRMINPLDLPQRLAALHGALAGKPFRVSYKIRRADGQQVEIEETGVAQTDEETGDKIICGTLSAQITGALIPDAGSLVEHGGRHALCRAIEIWMDEPEDMRRGKGYMLATGIDRVSMMNEAFGALYGDDLIEKTGLRLREIAGEAATIARINGDVFGLFFPHGPHGEMPAVAQHILDCFCNMPLISAHGHMNVGVSIGGTALSPRDDRDIASVITRAETALHSAKEHGRGCFVSYSEAAGRAGKTRDLLQTGNEFLHALKEGRVKLAFQPVMNFRTQQVRFHECLIRMVDEEGKMRPASEFMPAVEHMGLTRLVDQFVMNKAIHELNQFPDLSLSLNVSYGTLVNSDWLRGIVMALRDSPSIARRLIIEITEGMVMRDIAKAGRVVKTLRQLGCRVALDDFGAGFTTFSQMKDIELDIVKIDKSFIRNIREPRNQLFLRTLQALASGVSLETVGEGVETMEEARLLADEGIDNVQGYALGFPSPERVWLPRGHAFRQIADEAPGLFAPAIISRGVH
jgi:diguanylate cyclase (GGDEF)-like protein